MFRISCRNVYPVFAICVPKYLCGLIVEVLSDKSVSIHPGLSRNSIEISHDDFLHGKIDPQTNQIEYETKSDQEESSSLSCLMSSFRL